MQYGVERFGHRIHAFCLMTNHIHLAIEVADKPLSAIMQNLSFRYTQWLNWKRKRSGHLFQGRFKAVLVEADSYLLELVRYINLNPVRAGMTDDPFAYEWSSHKAYCGVEIIPWLSTEFVLGQLASTGQAAARAYQDFAADGLEEGSRPEFHVGGQYDGRVLGGDDFVQRSLGKTEGSVCGSLNLGQIVDAVAEELMLEPEQLVSPGKGRRFAEARAAVAWLVQEVEGVTLKEAADRFGRDASSLSSAAQRFRQRMVEDDRLRERFLALKNKLPN